MAITEPASSELEQAARTAVVIIAGLVDHARKYLFYEQTSAGELFDQIEKATVELASVLPENRGA